MLPRRFLPSISSLLALEAVERRGTATAAAEELSLTHSAISRQLKVLEDQMAVPMFVRDGKRLALTLAGQQYARTVRGVLQDLAQASLHLRAAGAKQTINLGTLPAFAMHWLAPRLRAFQTAHPDILVNQYTRLAPFDFGNEALDAAIHYGTQDWAGVNYLWLKNDRVIPACAPDMGPFTPQQLLDQPLLHLDTRPGAWEAWFATHGVTAERLRGNLFDQFAAMAQAARTGQGVALLPDYLAEDAFASGTLVPAVPDYVATEGAYYLVWPNNRELPEPLRDLIVMLRDGKQPTP